MKKNKLTNYLKIGILFFGISLLLWNCEKETNENFSPTSYNITIDETIAEFSINFNSENFRFIPKKPIWKDVK
ncbi:hypothetical protein [Polaribacter sp. IC073]|uniref:hypothetical protein n=1 Tax=Polaribacter sp. IC073 TaxID=2508540 RepID=UPI0011BE7563|nr:hypothetical protein [Polaribacter sp. IC073]TXD49999.1 hypothetical protein ES045_02120 [Polaribacter sp. IC073]